MCPSRVKYVDNASTIEYGTDGTTVISISPGWVWTDMGGSSAPLSVQESATRFFPGIDAIPLSCSGQSIDIDGDLHPY